MKTVELIKDNILPRKKFILKIPNRPQRFSFKGQAIKFAEDNNLKVIDLVVKEPKKIKFNKNWQ